MNNDLKKLFSILSIIAVLFLIPITIALAASWKTILPLPKKETIPPGISFVDDPKPPPSLSTNHPLAFRTSPHPSNQYTNNFRKTRIFFFPTTEELLQAISYQYLLIYQYNNTGSVSINLDIKRVFEHTMVVTAHGTTPTYQFTTEITIFPNSTDETFTSIRYSDTIQSQLTKWETDRLYDKMLESPILDAWSNTTYLSQKYRALNYPTTLDEL